MTSRRVSSPVSLPPFQKLLDAYGSDIHRFLIATVGRDAADDCYQETWLSALRTYPRLQHDTNLRGWLFTIAQRKAIDHTRRLRAVLVGELPESPEPTATATDHDLWTRVRALPAKQRTALVLRFVIDADYREISSVMATTPEAARRNVHEALKRLRRETNHE